MTELPSFRTVGPPPPARKSRLVAIALTIFCAALLAGGSLPEVNARVECVAFSPDGKFLASGASRNLQSQTSHYGGIRVWDIEVMSAVSAFEKYRGNIHMLAFKPDGTVLAGAEWPSDPRPNSFVTFWDVKERVVINRFDVERFGELYTISYSHDGRWLASGGRSGRIRLWQ